MTSKNLHSRICDDKPPFVKLATSDYHDKPLFVKSIVSIRTTIQRSPVWQTAVSHGNPRAQVFAAGSVTCSQIGFNSWNSWISAGDCFFWLMAGPWFGPDRIEFILYMTQIPSRVEQIVYLCACAARPTTAESHGLERERKKAFMALRTLPVICKLSQLQLEMGIFTG